MHYESFLFEFDAISRFHASLFIQGWFHDTLAEDDLKRLSIESDLVLAQTYQLHLPHDGVADLGRNKGFTLQVITKEIVDPRTLKLRFETKKKRTFVIPFGEVIERKVAESDAIEKKFAQLLEQNNTKKIIDIGGRARSGVHRSQHLAEKGLELTIFDVIADKNVDVVGDAHQLSHYFAPATFDAFISLFTFEHLFIPWKVVLEINKILKPGAIGIIITHQTLGMHDLPWDFWRFSEFAWDALFNEYTGFKILEKEMSLPQFIIPFHHYKDNSEKSAGFEKSAVIVQKIAEPTLSWEADLTRILKTTYPVG